MKLKVYYDEHYKEKIIGIRTKYVECTECIAFPYDCEKVNGTALKKICHELGVKKRIIYIRSLSTNLLISELTQQRW